MPALLNAPLRTIRQRHLRYLLAIDVGGMPKKHHNKAGVQFVDRPRRREAAGGQDVVPLSQNRRLRADKAGVCFARRTGRPLPWQARQHSGRCEVFVSPGSTTPGECRAQRGIDRVSRQSRRYLMGDGFAPIKWAVTTQSELPKRPPQSRLGHLLK